jgi:hypothetical protein
MSLAKRFFGVLGLAAVLSAGGCYRYTAVPVGEVSPAHHVRARLSLQEAERMEALFPGRNPRVIEGRVVQLIPDTLLLDVAVSSDLRMAQGPLLAQRIDVPLRGIIDLEVRELSRARTVALVSASVAIVGAAIGGWVIRSGGERRPGHPPSDESRVPLWR